MKPKICLVEDEPTIRELVSEALREAGYDVEALEAAEPLTSRGKLEADLYILDVLLPGESGLDACRKLRKLSSTIPILILSALSDPADRVEGLKVGADDYLPKPFEMEELLLRIRGMLRRRSWYREYPNDQTTFHWAENSVDFVKLEARRGTETFKMSEKECMLMKLLIENEGQVVSRDVILDRIWGYDIFPSTRTVDNFILKLRRYFEREPSQPVYIHSVRGSGYRFTSKGQLKTSER